MAIFGRNTARQRLRRAARESLAIPAFSSPLDCTPWVVGGLWPAELSTATPVTATAADYLRTDLRRIVDAANDELRAIRGMGMPGSVRQAEETRVINTARAYAVRRVDSTIRHLHATAAQKPPSAQPGPQSLDAALGAGEPAGRHAAADGVEAEDAPADTSEAAKHAKPSAAAGLDAPLPVGSTPPAPGPAADVTTLLSPVPRTTAPLAETLESAAAPTPVESEGESERLWRLLQYVARQEPGLRWAVGNREDGSTLLVTDLAHGWIPPGITVPGEVSLLAPDRRSGNAGGMLGPKILSATYAPGDPLGWTTDPKTQPSLQPRELPTVDDLGWALNQATHWRDGLPRMVNTLARAGAAGTGVVEAEVDVLRVHLDTVRYQLLAQYPDIDTGLLLNCLLLAATEGIATDDRVSANYHFAWFQKLSAPPASKWAGDS